MALLFQLTPDITLDLDQILNIHPVRNGLQVTYMNASVETIIPVSETDLNRLIDVWICKSDPACTG